eukprot:GFUD01037256.1.p1 GENE.GFUD01037256.1~~GFUD01037256.1.p1  ORF type:complete len:202 (-),score=100.32 GFUD01037256.1:90-695(-)
MGGRGRGRGTGLSFNAEALGFGRGDALPTAMMAPPPMFPPLTNQPVKLVEDSEQEYILTVGKELRNAFRGSQYFLGRKGDPLPQLDLRWERLPAELKPGGLKKKAKKAVKPNLVKKSKVDIEQKLDELGKLEEKKGDDSEEEKDVEKADSEDEDKKSEAASGEDEPDEEMDGGTDYASNYFDNGEGFGDDEDDNLDEGGIY